MADDESSSLDLSTSEEESSSSSRGPTGSLTVNNQPVSGTRTSKLLLADYFVVCGLNYDETPVLFAGKPVDPKSKKEKIVPSTGVSYKAKELHRFPEQDHHKDRPLPPHLWVFLFPTGVQLEEHSLPPRFFVNALTYSDGTRSYVIAIKFYEKTGWQLKKTGSSTRTRSTSINVKKGIDVLYAPKAICYVTQLPLFSFFKQYLSELFLLSQPSSLSGNVPLERYISQLVSPIPIEFGLSRVFDKQYKLSFVIGKSTIPCVLPNLAVDFCITDVSFRYLFQALSVDTVITLLAALLTEQKILFHSQHYVLLITVLQSLIDLMLPFQWPHTYIPTVPSNLLEFIDAPTPYVMGVHVDQMASLGSLSDVIVVDCDRHTMTLPSFFVPLPEDLQSWMAEKLNTTLAKFGVSKKSKDFIEAEMEKIDLAFATSYGGSFSDAEFTLELRMCTMSLFARLFFDFERYVNHNSHSSRMTLFDEPSFTASRDERHRQFVADVACRSVWEMFLSSPEAKLFSQFNRLALEVSEANVFATIEAERKAAVPMHVNVPAPESGSTICSYSMFPALDHSLYQKLAVTKGTSVPKSLAEPRIFSDISQKIRLMVDEGSSKERIVIVETMYNLIKSLRSGNVDAILASRAEAWFRGAPIETVLEVYEKRSPRSGSFSSGAPNSPALSGNRSGSGLMKTKVMAMAKKLRSPLMRHSQSTIVPEVAEERWRNPDSWESDTGPPGAERRESARESMRVFLQILKLYCDAGEVRFQRKPFRDLCFLLEAVVKQSDLGLKLAQASKVNDTNSSADDDTEMGVVVCWACGEVNKVGYGQCAACSEPPLGAHADDEPSTTEDRGLLSQPKGEEKAYFEILKSVLIVGTSAFCSSMDGLVLQQQQFSVQAEKLSIWSRYDFWQWCIFSDYCEKSGASMNSVAKDPYSIPAYPELFPLAAFYLNAMVSVRLPVDLASSFVKRLPFASQIRDTLNELSSRLVESRDAPSSAPSRNSNRGVRVMNRSRLLNSQKMVAAQMSKVATGGSITAKVDSRRTSLEEIDVE